jgi:hypothetical protein
MEFVGGGTDQCNRYILLRSYTDPPHTRSGGRVLKIYAVAISPKYSSGKCGFCENSEAKRHWSRAVIR